MPLAREPLSVTASHCTHLYDLPENNPSASHVAAAVLLSIAFFTGLYSGASLGLSRDSQLQSAGVHGYPRVPVSANQVPNTRRPAAHTVVRPTTAPAVSHGTATIPSTVTAMHPPATPWPRGSRTVSADATTRGATIRGAEAGGVLLLTALVVMMGTALRTLWTHHRRALSQSVLVPAAVLALAPFSPAEALPAPQDPSAGPSVPLLRDTDLRDTPQSAWSPDQSVPRLSMCPSGGAGCVSSNALEPPNASVAPLLWPRLLSRMEAFQAALQAVESEQSLQLVRADPQVGYLRFQAMEGGEMQIAEVAFGDEETRTVMLRCERESMERPLALKAPPPFCVTPGCINGASRQRTVLKAFQEAVGWRSADEFAFSSEARWTPLFFNEDRVPDDDV
eukprot:CAMPEP_0174310854 /NCGR_PEP_ID=MMETSP0810-20121108/3327_1 /TAXON_ID=73025 ORGANISM="Eutreptiella gymnastica-like, Strain CCMP1594" /NCGR_SAMPLE_ID=MMETSP0810 /ASSEMBLY_ACC=CAM_ASM_000659 /LENGTH=392 /DNA_ID=CAMNT_0015418905 /DNA_START=30 /DNA_END=1208 /DNA_ORIENTATION=-